ncbi:MAG: Ig-like domain repeat protein, partial [Promethearchaeota archaeon]
WINSSWTPLTTGVFLYTIYAVDASGNLNTTSGSITVEDTTVPNLFNVVESADPLELGGTESFSVNITDLSSLSGVWITVDGQTFNLTQSGNEVWTNSSWFPSSTGTYPYTIYAIDASGNLNTTIGSISIVDTTVPNLFNVVESTDPLELGGTESFSVNITDLSSLSGIWITVDGQTFNFTQSGSEVWTNSSWTPSTTGTYPYTIYAVDASGNLNTTSGSITVEDTTFPNLFNVVESADPLELGGFESFSVNITDLSLLSGVWITVDGQTFNLTQSGAEVWTNSSWFPSTTGTYPYTIYAVDASGNLNTTAGSISVVDITVPNLFNVVESADPLELGGTESFSVNITDLSSLSGVWITVDGQNFNLTQSGTEVWTNSSWFPSTTGTYPYTIYAVDASGNFNTTSGSITVEDTTVPNLFNVVESADPLELGGTESFSVNITDLSSLSGVWITVDSQTFNFTQFGAEVWINSSWTPSTTGIFPYTIYAVDISGNLNTTTGSITVEDTTIPNLFNVVESADPLELGGTESFSVNITNLSPLSRVWIIVDSQSFNLTQSGSEVWTNSSWTPSTTGTYFYTIYAVDVSGNLNSTTGSISVVDTTIPNLFNVEKSADPLELGETEYFSVNITDLSSLSGVWITVNGQTFNLTQSGVEVWTNSSWTPSSTGTYSFTIYAVDASGNINSTSGNILIIDSYSPNIDYFSLTPDANAIQVGENISLMVNASDISGINQVLVNFDEKNYTLYENGENSWIINDLVINQIGNFNLTLLIQDNNDNWNSTIIGISVEDNIFPIIVSLFENIDPNEFGDYTEILVNVTDNYLVKSVEITIDNETYPLDQIHEDQWQFLWNNSKVGTFSYEILIIDGMDNTIVVYDSLTIRDTILPIITEYSLEKDLIGIQDNINISLITEDVSGIRNISIYIGGFFYDFTTSDNISFHFDDWSSSNPGIFQFSIKITDNNGNVNTIVDTIEVQAKNNIDPNGMEGDENNLLNIFTPSIIIISGFAFIPIIVKQRKRKIGKGWEIPK